MVGLVHSIERWSRSPNSGRDMADVPYVRALIIASILDGIPVNVYYYVVQMLKEYMFQGSSTLMFLSLITKLCRCAQVEEWNGDHWIPLDKPFHPLRVNGEGSVIKSKKKKMEIVVSEGSSSQAIQAEGLFWMLNS